MKSMFRLVRLVTGVALLVPALGTGARAQTHDDRGGFAVREVSLSTGYAAVQLPPITLSGFLPNDVLSVDLITSGTAQIDWRRVTPHTTYRFELFGAYTARARYSQLNAPSANLTFGVSRALGHRWRFGAGAASAIVSSDLVAFQQSGTRRLVDDAESFDDLAGNGALARSPSPDPAQAGLFVPISQTLVGSDLYVNRVVASSVEADATYVHSSRRTTYFHGSYTSVRRIPSNHDSEQLLLRPESAAGSAGMRLRYSRSERTRLTAAVNWSRASGLFTHEGVSATLGYGWSGRKWFAEASAGGLVVFEAQQNAAPFKTTRSLPVAIVYSAAVGYKFRTQTLLVQYTRAPHDEYGNGGQNVATGFEGDVQSVGAAWSWLAPRRRWMAQSDFSMIRRPGNFSYIYAWLSTAGVGRRLGPNLRLMGEVLFDRHGSRGFEGFHLTREGVRLNLVWTPPQRPVE